MAVRCSVLALCVTAALSTVGCTEHLVGPARTRDDFRRKAKTTAEHALSAVETVRLVADTAARGRSFGPYASVSISEQEDALNDVQGDFDSIQPPDDASDRLRAELDGLLSAAIDHIVDVRLAARRGVLGGLGDAAGALSTDSRDLNTFLETVS